MSVFIEIPLFVKASSIIPMQSLIQRPIRSLHDTLFVHIYNGSNPNSFEYYEDDGSTMDYQKGSFYNEPYSLIPVKIK